MASLNLCQFIGNLGDDPTLRYTPSGEAVANLSIAVSEKWKDKSSGEQREATEWVKVSFFGRLAEVCGEYLKKGASVYVSGSMRTRKYEKDGSDRYITEIRGQSLQMIGGKRDSGQSEAQPARQSRPAAAGAAPSKAASGFDDMDDDIPF